MEPVLDVANLTKRFGHPETGFTAVDRISFSLKEGEIVGLLGPNGAGKTTTTQMLLGLMIPTSGTIRYFGRDFFSHREYCLSRINFTSAYSHMQGKLTLRQNLRIFAGLYGVADYKKRVEELAALFGVEPYLDQLIWHLSSGQKTRANLVKALLNRPRLLLMDEPTASLDPEIVDTVLELILDLQKREKITILYTSHNMGEVERICDRVLFLYRGKIVDEDSPLGFTKRIGEVSLTITFDGPRDAVDAYLKEEKVTFAFPRDHVVEIKATEEKIPHLLFGFSKRTIWVTNIDIEKPDLEDVFLSIAKGNIHELAAH